MSYRQSRNIEASLIDKITAQLVTDGWSGIRTEKAFSQVYEGELPCILVQVSNIAPTRKEVGSKTWIKYCDVSIRVFATSDGNREDLSDWLTDLFENDINYYTYTITSGIVSSKVLAGRICILNITRNEKEFINEEVLAKEDKYRHIITFRCYVALS